MTEYNFIYVLHYIYVKYIHTINILYPNTTFIIYIYIYIYICVLVNYYLDKCDHSGLISHFFRFRTRLQCGLVHFDANVQKKAPWRAARPPMMAENTPQREKTPFF